MQVIQVRIILPNSDKVCLNNLLTMLNSFLLMEQETIIKKNIDFTLIFFYCFE